ncbi:hypothetical protein PRUPE_6G322700 [Prunus persica]|uniref:PWWP domain-containing protein n=1 Tax=Prunus persica TaxID=3760 RepID=A0A251NYR3_PRUPE|nr:uncharacterized protein LOC18775569 [Prunus persica]ONI04457.1 hypothetical protein PRUPE_6G322700 [Prunus persica]
MNNDFELDGKSGATVEVEEARARVSEGGAGSSKDEARVSTMEFDSGAPESEAGDSRVSRGGRSEEDRARVRVSPESDVRNVDKVMESKGSGIQLEKASVFVFHDDQEDVFDIGRVEIDEDYEKFDNENDEDDRADAEKDKSYEHRSLLSEFDEFVANEKSGVALGTSRALSYGFEVGDLVWGKVKSHPWWPGHIFNEAFASSQVRRTRREGHVLVAFFGDSSYGWFDPAELIPFDPHFAEKSLQTNHRTFVKAVEEAVDEANRRCGVGLACKCRNPYNFRATSVQGYFVVDVPDYEPGAVYSENQIKKVRDSFKPSEILSFLKQLAVLPHGDDQKSLNFNKNKATAFAFRKAVFEEYDETYAQAFGVHQGRSSRKLVAPVDPPRAPLSGPLVIAEVLGGRKNATKPMKVKDHSKKDKYVFKRRDEPSNLKTHLTSQGQASSSAPFAGLEGSIPLVDGDYTVQKRAPAVSTKTRVPAKHEQTDFIGRSSTVSNTDVYGKEAVIIDQATANSSLTTQDVTNDAKPSLDKERGALQEVKDGGTSTECLDLFGEGTKQRTKDGTSQPLKQEAEGLVEIKCEESAKLSGSHENFQQPSSSLKKVEGGYELNQVRDGRGVGDPSSVEAKSSGGMKAIGGVKKAKVLKRRAEDLRTEDSMMGDNRKKKKKKQLGSEASFRNPQKPLTSGKVHSSGSKVAGNSKDAGLAPREDIQVEHHKKDVVASNNSSETVGKFSIVGLGDVELELPQLVSDLQALALDPFHGFETNSPAIVRQFFLHFRSLVYQKSLVLSPPSETEPVEVRSSKSPSGVKASDISPTEQVRDLPFSKAAKPMFRSDDPTIAGRKRAPSDRQGDIAAKRSKKISDLKTLAAEKKASQRALESKRVEAKESAVPLLRRSIKPGFAKKTEPASKAVEPTMLVMKFPPKISLPSPAELKAKFARFGPMDQSGLRVFWKSATCRVVFLHKSDAQAALKFATANSSLFGNFSVRCQIREVGGPEVPDSGKGDNPSEIPRVKDSSVGQSPAMASALRQQQQALLPQSAVQLKSILKKSSGEEQGGQVTTGGNGNSKGTARVKFMLGGEESSRSTDQFMMAGNRNNFNNNNSSASFADGGAAAHSSSTSSIAMDFNTRNFQKVNAPPTFSSSPPILPPPLGPPLPPQYAKPPHNKFPQHHSEMAPPRNSQHLNTPTAFPSAPSVDISHQMLSLLTRCNDVVANVKGLLGYVPYHPL